MNSQTDIYLKANESSSIPQWSATLPSKELIKRGLKFDILQKEVKELNAVSNENTTWSPPLWIGLVVLVIGCALCGFGGFYDFNKPILIVGCLLCGFGLLCCVGSGLCHNRQIEGGFEMTRLYIEVDLNKKYKSKDIRWSVVAERRQNTHFDNSSLGTMFGFSTSTQMVHHIIVSCSHV